MDRELRLAGFQTWLEEWQETASKQYFAAEDGSKEEEYWLGASVSYDSVVRKLKEALGE